MHIHQALMSGVQNTHKILEEKTRNITFRTEIGAGYTSVNWPRRLVTANLRTTSSVVSLLLGGGGS